MSYVVEWRMPRARRWRKLTTRRSLKTVQKFATKRAARAEIAYERALEAFLRARSECVVTTARELMAEHERLREQAKRPEGLTKDDIMSAAWLGFIQFAWGEPKICAEFTAATGIAIPGARSGIESLVDNACGFDPMKDVLEQFVEWVTVAMWGIEDAPAKYREMLQAKNGAVR